MSRLDRLAAWIAASVKPLDTLAGAVEAAFLALVTRAASWAASIPNALMVARSAVVMFDVSFGLGLTIAISLELIGHSLMSLWLDMREHNATKRVSDQDANEHLALGLLCVFFCVDVSMVGALCFYQHSTTGNGLIWLALAYPVIGIVVAIATNSRAHLWRIKQDIATGKREAAEARQAKRQGRHEGGIEMADDAAPMPQAAMIVPRDAARAIIAANPGITGAALAAQVGIAARTARQWKTDFAAETASDGNGRH